MSSDLTIRSTAFAFACGFTAGALVVHTLSKKKKTAVSDRPAWVSIFQTRLMAAWAAAITLGEQGEADSLLNIGQQYFGEERWAIGHHEFEDPEL